MAKDEKKRKEAYSTQRYLDILEIKDDCVVLKDGTLRGVMLVSSINFALKSEEEQNAVISGYMQFLNSLDFPIQIVVQSRKLNIDEYIERLKDIEKRQTNDLLRIQTQEYRQYIGELVELSDIMSKKFYVVIPFAPGKGGTKKFFSVFREALSPTSVIHLKQKKFEKYRDELGKRVGYVLSGLSSTGLNAVQLDTQGLIELYYDTYNPEIAPQQKFVEANKLNLEA